MPVRITALPVPLFRGRAAPWEAQEARQNGRAGVSAFEDLKGRCCPSTLYDFDLVAATGGELGLSGMGNGPSINDEGTVAFVGDFPTGAEGIFTGDGTTAGLRNINPSWSTDPNRVYGDPVEMNDLGEVLAVDRYSAPGSTQFTLRTWNASAMSADQIVATAGGLFSSFDSISTYAAINNDNDIVYSAFDASSASPTWNLQYQPSTSAFATTIATLAAPQALRPVISNSPSVVARIGGSNSTADPLTGYTPAVPGETPAFASFGVAGAGSGFDQVGQAPGISADGNVIAFAGDVTAAGASALGLTPGPGIFARGNGVSDLVFGC